MMSPNGNAEFGLHFFKRRAGAKKVDRYNIGVWEGTHQRAICRDACLECALAAVRREMERAGLRRIAKHLSTKHTSKVRLGRKGVRGVDHCF